MLLLGITLTHTNRTEENRKTASLARELHSICPSADYRSHIWWIWQDKRGLINRSISLFLVPERERDVLPPTATNIEPIGPYYLAVDRTTTLSLYSNVNQFSQYTISHTWIPKFGPLICYRDGLRPKHKYTPINLDVSEIISTLN